MRIEKKKNISFSDLFDCFCVVFCLDFFEKRKNNIIILRAYVGSLLNAFKVFFFSSLAYSFYGPLKIQQKHHCILMEYDTRPK